MLHSWFIRIALVVVVIVVAVAPPHLEDGVVDRHRATAVVLLEACDSLDRSVQRLDIGEGDPRVDDVEQRNF